MPFEDSKEVLGKKEDWRFVTWKLRADDLLDSMAFLNKQADGI